MFPQQWFAIVRTGVVISKPLFDAMLAIGLSTALDNHRFVQYVQTYTTRVFIQFFGVHVNNSGLLKTY